MASQSCSKCTAITYNGTRINIVVTPSHADFGGEVKEVLVVVASVLLLVVAFGGPLPRTLVVAEGVSARACAGFIVINKIDREGCNPQGMLNAVFDLFCALDATEEQLEAFPVVYASGYNSYAIKELDDEKKDLTPLMDMIVRACRRQPLTSGRRSVCRSRRSTSTTTWAMSRLAASRRERLRWAIGCCSVIAVKMNSSASPSCWRIRRSSGSRLPRRRPATSWR